MQNRINIIQGCVFKRGSSSELKPTRVYAQRPVRQTKLTPCEECVGKVPESFAQVLARCSSLAQTKYMTWHNAALIELYFDGNAKGPQACRLFSSLVLTSGAQPVVPVRRRSSILRFSCLRRARTWLIGDLLTTRRWVWWLWKWAVHDWTTARRRILRRQRSTKHCGGSLLSNTQSTRSSTWTSSLTFCWNNQRS